MKELKELGFLNRTVTQSSLPGALITGNTLRYDGKGKREQSRIKTYIDSQVTGFLIPIPYFSVEFWGSYSLIQPTVPQFANLKNRIGDIIFLMGL